MRTALLLLATVLLAEPGTARAQPGRDRHESAARLLSYSGVFKDNYTSTVLRPFAASHGSPVEFVDGESSASILEQIRAQKEDPKLDLVIMDASAAAVACAEGLVDPLPSELLPLLNDLYPAARDAGGECGPGVTFDHLVIVYDAAKFSTPPVSLRVLWNPAWRGRVAVAAPPNIQGLALTALLAHADTADWRNADGAFRELRDLAPSVKTFDPQPDGYTLVLNGTVVFATGWNARAQFYRDRSDGRLGVMLPDEGTVFQINTINLLHGAPHRHAGVAFMGYALSPPAQKALAERMYYAPTNAMAQIDPGTEARTAASPFNMAKVVPVDWREMARLRGAWEQRWRDVIEAGGRR
jgi:putative spermidine/putrescine transport system substrate-binding protein